MYTTVGRGGPSIRGGVGAGYRRYKDRNRIERMFGKLKQQRRIATRYDKTVLSFEGYLDLAAARLWLKTFVKAA